MSESNAPLEQQLRQIGNAVPVPLSRALGRALGEALIKMWEAEAGAGVEVEMEVDAEAENRESGSPEL